MNHYKSQLNKRQYLDNQKSQHNQDSNHNPVMLARIDSGPGNENAGGRSGASRATKNDGRRRIGDCLFNNTTKPDALQQLCCDALSRYFATSDTRHVDIYRELVRLLKRGSKR